ncbi:membrane protein UL20 [Human betaherpesvirus 5]|uniref:Membrane protein UL20 n=1 Tax=Human cytomegalovirus TaxID=10359 RepID=A0A0A7CGP9_HCMV|nr:membrane protein UL20 [Human betaherpesvirus 5]WNA12889.1 membrane protein UL20 [Cytomegalovirus humanbeta5]AKI10262.1 membrane protein UL20 [Human betaherpesvirus 5]AKI14434.1 membrane protein UL20 [Human betaherpesvirus 5]AKI19281.1 membrane protein UL20 [Human betaherpesvirus 5]
MLGIHAMLVMLNYHWAQVTTNNDARNNNTDTIFVSLLTGPNGVTRTAVGGLYSNYTNLTEVFGFTQANTTTNSSAEGDWSVMNLTETCINRGESYLITLWLLNCTQNNTYWYSGNAYNHTNSTCENQVSKYLFSGMCQLWKSWVANDTSHNTTRIELLKNETRCTLPAKQYTLNATVKWYNKSEGDIPKEFMSYAILNSVAVLTCGLQEAYIFDMTRRNTYLFSVSCIGITSIISIILASLSLLILICYYRCGRLLICPRGFERLPEFTEEEEEKENLLTHKDIEVQVPIRTRRLLVPWIRESKMWTLPPPLPPRPPHLIEFPPSPPSSPEPTHMVICIPS